MVQWLENQHSHKGVGVLSKRKKILTIVILTGTVAAGIAIWLCYRPQSVTLPEGSRLLLHDVTYGTNTIFRGTVAERLFARWLPNGGIRLGKLKLQKPAPSRLHHSNPHALNVWINAHSTNLKKLSGVLTSQVILIASNELGAAIENRLSAIYLEQRHNTPDHSAEGVVALHAYPRDGKLIDLIFIWENPTNGWQNLGSFSVDNPSQGTAESWIADTLPKTNRLFGLNVILDSAVLTTVTPKELGLKTTEIALRIEHSTTRKLNWQPLDLVARDGHGNFQMADSFAERNGRYRILVPAVAQDGVWKIEVTLAFNSRYRFEDLKIPLHHLGDSASLGLPIFSNQVAQIDFYVKPKAARGLRTK